MLFRSLNKEYYGSLGFNAVVGVGTVGVDPNSKVYVKYNDNYSEELYYSLEKDGNKISLEVDDENNSQIIFVDSVYNGKYNVYGIGSTYFSINLRDYPEKTSYTQYNCDILNYSTTSKNTKGGIANLTILDNGYNYDSLPTLKNIISDEGQNALIVPFSNGIGSITNYEILNQGFEYFSDKTLRPEAYIYPVIFLKDFNTISSIDILDPGKGYFTPPNLLLKDTETKKIIDSNSLSCKVPYGSVSEINIESPIYGLGSYDYEIICADRKSTRLNSSH